MELVCIVDVAEILLRNGTNLPPTVLDVPELGEGILHVAGVLYKGLQLFDNGLLCGKILLAEGVLLLVVFGAFLLVIDIKGLEAGFDGCEGAQRAALKGNGAFHLDGVLIRFLYGVFLAGVGLFLGQTLVEGRFDGLCLF